MTSAFYAPDAVRGVRFDDPVFNIDWPLAATTVSEQDRNWPLVGKGRRGEFASNNLVKEKA
jgi:dTDP-4-dehydrorhamnose 3,5-epimerase